MEKFIENLAIRYFYEHRDHFAEGAVFQRFVKAEGLLTVENVYPSTVFGYLAYKVGDDVRLSDRMRILYLVSDLTAAQSPTSSWFTLEATFYGLVWPACSSKDEPQLVPKFCASTAYWRPKKLVAASMFENRRGYMTFGYTRCLDFDHQSLMARKIGQFHGCVLRHAATSGEMLMRERSGVLELYSQQNCQIVQPTLLRCLKPLYTDPLYTTDSTFAPAVERVAAKICRLDEDLAAISRAPARCRILCHMNYSQASVFFKYDGEDVVDAMIGNWGTADYCSLGADLVILLFVEGDANVDHRVRVSLMSEYFTTLRQYCPQSQMPHLREVVVEIKRCVPIALFTLGARLEGLNVGPCLSMKTEVSPHWNDQFVTTIFKSLILNKYI